jgi:threonine aldolase
MSGKKIINSTKHGFASDNNSGVSPEVLKKIEQVNTGHCVGYGDDPFTEEAIQLFKMHFGDNSIPYFTFTGTASNVLGIGAGIQSFQSVICPSTAHIYVDECGAPEKFNGCKVQAIDTEDGKLTPELVSPLLTGFGFEHHSQPGIISISQSTEMGTVYTVDEISLLANLAHKNNMLLHMDGARLANAVVSLNKTFKEVTQDAGVDILSFGGTKNGLMAAESIVFFDDKVAQNFKYLRKQGMQLASKMRFIAAQFIAYLSTDLWRTNALHANNMAAMLHKMILKIPEVTVTQKVEANGIFAIVPRKVIGPLRKEFFYYTWDEGANEVRWMTSFDTTERDIEQFIKTLTELIKGNK